jgi:tetratricopeptide (TPR) repeat protein
MTPERFRQIEALYHAARARTGDERAALLAQSDPELRRAVESLLEQPAGGELLDRPALQNAGEDNASEFSDSTATGFTAETQFGPYRIEGKLGEGGMGEVFRAVDTRLGRAVAIKTADEQFSARFEREARAISSLNHPNICTLYDVGELPTGLGYLVMELVEGETLAARLKAGPFPLKTALLYASQILAALVEAHGKGVIHRDIKPGNIMIAKSGIKVLDFGLAKSGEDETLTASRAVMGTPAYMSPEQRAGKPADNRSDIYSFGCVLYEMLTGARIASRRRSIPSRKLERIVNRCLEEDPGRRWQSVAELEPELASASAAAIPWKIVSAAAAILAVFAAAFFSFHRAPRLTDKDTIVLADFLNTTGDPIFDGTLRQGLAIQLEQSPFLKIMDDQHMLGVLRRMNLPPSTRVTDPIAHEICVRDDAAATIGGAIASLGKNYVITLQATACQGGATLDREQVQAADKEHVLNAIGTAATAMRGKLGESLSSIQKLNRPLEFEQATTASLEALQSYTAGMSELDVGHFLAAVPLFERATVLDPKFAMAYAYIGTAYNNAGDVAKERDYTAKAFRLIDRASEFEGPSIAGIYYGDSGELDKAIDAYRQGVRNYPRYWGFLNNLSETLIQQGQYEEGLREGLEAARLQPDVEPPYRRLLDSYMCLNRPAEARQVREKLRQLGLGGARIHQRFLELAYVDGDAAEIGRETQWFAGKPEEYLSLGLQAASRNVLGQRIESRKLFQRAAERARRAGLQNAAAEFEEADAQDDAYSGNCQTARRLGRPALALAICGDAAEAEKLAAAASKLSPNDTRWNNVHLPEIDAAIALERGQPAKSVDLLASASPYEGAYLEATYLRGLAYLRLNKGSEAEAEFQKIVDHKGASWASRWQHPYWGQVYSLSYLGLARGSALAGDTEKAKKAFQDFFELWKDADPDVPILKQAKAEYARLQ